MAPIQFFQNWENDAIFCNPIQWIAKNGIVFPILKELNWRPAAASGNDDLTRDCFYSSRCAMCY